MAEVIPTKRHFFITKPLLCNMFVTGANKGIGLEICRQLASKGVLVFLTARDEERGLEAVKSLKVSDSNMFRQPQKVNNAGVLGSGVKAEDRKNFRYSVEDVTYIHNTSHEYEKLGPRRKKCIFIRYSEHSKGFVFIGEKAYGRVTEIESRDVVFLEKVFPKASEVEKDFQLYEMENLDYGETSHSVEDLDETFNPPRNSGSDILSIPTLIEEDHEQSQPRRSIREPIPRRRFEIEGEVFMIAPQDDEEPKTFSHALSIVTGANKGIGLEICRQLASKGVLVFLTARDEERGLEAVKSLKVSDSNMFRQPQQVNNAGVLGSGVKAEDRKNFRYSVEDITGPNAVSQKKFVNQTYEITVSCLRTNYYGTKHLTEALIPILEQSSSARIVNVSSTLGKLKFIPNEKAKKELGDVDGLTEEKVEKLVEDFLEDVKNDLVETKHWPPLFSAYIVSKAALNAYTRILAKKYPKIATNAVCPGFTSTDINDSTGIFTVEEAARGPVMLALMPDHQRPSGCFFFQTEMSTF
ncbi:hypothetical protein POTOM_018289 [Populus tomentosa]|uniref:Retroviral polymerase SH3-like domain-containing protein n=1 Tax=Populus tomentosa TaxID=118781 RepID=A0A8X8A0N1_POPTO|nr:hypothetical protein POTOM_018289 [Populus tomentosa]